MASRAKRVTKTYSRRNRNYDSGNRSNNRTFSHEIGNPPLLPSQPLPTPTNDSPPSPYAFQGTEAQNGLEDTLRAMCDGVACVERHLRSVKREASKIQDEIKPVVTCSICLSTFKDPYLTNCGHPFCLECLLGWLSVQLSGFQERNPGFILRNRTIDALKNPLSNPKKFIEAAKVAKRRYPQFTCPTCRSAITKRPVPFVVVGPVFTDLYFEGRRGAETAPPSQLDLEQVNHLFERYLLF